MILPIASCYTIALVKKFQTMAEGPKRLKQSQSAREHLDGPYHHPILEHQLIIRFPPDIAAKLSASMEEKFADFRIDFRDEHHASVSVFGEDLDAVLVTLPTLLETHRTVDGSHLFKSADVSQMLLVYRPNSAPVGITSDFFFESGLTPPTQDILAKRQSKRDYFRDNQDTDMLNGIDYWDIVELQLLALASKKDTQKPVCRFEFHDEPDVDPEVLEKVLRTRGRDDLRGYSGRVIPDDELAQIGEEHEPVVRVPPEILREWSAPAPEKAEIDADAEESELEIPLPLVAEAGATEEEEIVESESSPAQESQGTSSARDSDSDEEEDEYGSEEEEDEKIRQAEKQLKILRPAAVVYERQSWGSNPLIQEKHQKRWEEVKAKIAALEEEIRRLRHPS
jgi:transcription initiation factor TFIID subunit 7